MRSWQLSVENENFQDEILTTKNLKQPMFFPIGGDMMEVPHGRRNHKRLRKKMIICQFLRHVNSSCIDIVFLAPPP